METLNIISAEEFDDLVKKYFPQCNYCGAYNDLKQLSEIDNENRDVFQPAWEITREDFDELKEYNKREFFIFSFHPEPELVEYFGSTTLIKTLVLLNFFVYVRILPEGKYKFILWEDKKE